MAPLMQLNYHDSSEDVFSSERFANPLKMELEAASRSLPRRTYVRFNTEVQVINKETEYYTDEDIQTKWFGAEDLNRIKNDARDQSTEIRRSGSARDSYLCVAHRKTSLMLKSDFKSLVKLTPSTPDQDLSKWCSFSDGRRGLERFSSRDYAALRKSDIMKTRKGVITEYNRQRYIGQYDDEIVANFSREASRRARTFSRFFAAADANAAKNADNESSSSERRNMLSRCCSERPQVRCAPPRKRSKQYHRQELFSAAC